MKRYFIELGERRLEVELRGRSLDKTVTVTDESGTQLELEARVVSSNGRWLLTLGGRVMDVTLDGSADDLRLTTSEGEHRVQLSERAPSGETSGNESGLSERQRLVRALMPGRVVEVAVVAGQSVEVGARLCILEAMKMQNEVAAPASATVAKVHAQAGTSVERGAILIELE